MRLRRGIASALISTACGLAVSALPGCAVSHFHHAAPRRAPAPIRLGRLPGTGAASPRTWAPQAVVLPAHETQGAYVPPAPDWAPGAAPATPIRFLGTGKQIEQRTAQHAERHSEPPLRKPSGIRPPDDAGSASRDLARARPAVRIFFGFGSAAVPRKFRVRLGALPGGRLCIVGHADPRGGSAYNLRLSARRALAVARLLREAAARRVVEIEALGEAGAGPRYGFDRRADLYRGPCPRPK